MAAMDIGCIEIGNINTQASVEKIRRLKSILDQHAIFHIIDGVMFYDPRKQTARVQAIHRGRVSDAHNTQDDLHRNKFQQGDPIKFRELIVPDLYNLNFMSIIYFDSEEADFLSTLIYGENW